MSWLSLPASIPVRFSLGEVEGRAATVAARVAKMLNFMVAVVGGVSKKMIKSYCGESIKQRGAQLNVVKNVNERSTTSTAVIQG